MILLSSSPGETTRIPLRRFATHALLSALAVAVPQLLQYFLGACSKDKVFFISWNVTRTCGYFISIISSARCSDINIDYSIVAPALAAWLHMITILLGKYVSDPDFGFTARQHVAVHFCLAFCIITELEFYRAYANFKELDTYVDVFKRLHLANTDTSFTYCRDPFCYMLDLPDSCRCYVNGNNEPRTCWTAASSRPYWAFFASCLLFYAVGGLANYLIKRVVNPDPGYNLLGAMMNGFVLFGSYQSSYWELILGLALSRAVRQANYVGFWAVVELVKQCRGNRAMTDVEKKNKLEGEYKICANCGKHL